MPKRKRTTVGSKLKVQTKEEVNNSVLGGLKGGYRITGNEDATTENAGIEQFTVPLKDKSIICERRGGNGEPSLIFTHGAGGGIANPATKDFGDGFAEVSSIVSFQGTMNLQSRVQAFLAVIENEKTSRALGGRSMGARAAVLASQQMDSKPDALVLVSFPMVGGKKGDSREQILLDLDESIDVLFIIGSNDAMCEMKHLRAVIRMMKTRSWIIEVHDADHSMSLKQKAGVLPMRRKTGSTAAEWLKKHDDSRRYCSLHWDADEEKILCDGWVTTSEESEKESLEKSSKKKRKTK